MQTFIVNGGIGTRHELAGINENTIKLAKAFYRVSTDAISFVVDLDRPGNAFWFLTADVDRALELLAGESIGPVVSARTIKNNVKARREANQASHNAWALDKAGDKARRVSHVKFGAGTVLNEDAKAVTVLFDGQKKPLRMVPAMLVEVA